MVSSSASVSLKWTAMPSAGCDDSRLRPAAPPARIPVWMSSATATLLQARRRRGAHPPGHPGPRPQSGCCTPVSQFRLGPEPTSRSTTVRDTETSPGCAQFARLRPVKRPVPDMDDNPGYVRVGYKPMDASLSVRSPQTDRAHCAVPSASCPLHIAPWRSWSPSLPSRYGER